MIQYKDNFDPDIQIQLEESISEYINDEIYGSYEEINIPYAIFEDKCNQLGRDILIKIVEKLRPDLIEDI
jgi:hypothetical protein